MTDRSTPPPIRPLSKIVLPEIGLQHLDNGIPVYEVNAGTQEVVKLEFIFNAGRSFETKKLIGKATVNQLKEGAGNMSGAKIAETFDYFGCTLKTPFNLDTSNIAVFTLRKHLAKVLPTLREMLLNPVFPEEEVHSYISRNVKKLDVELAKNDVVAYRLITEKIFGADHPYGYNSSPELYRSISRQDLLAHHQNTYHAQNTQIIISGKTAGLTAELNEYFGNLPAAAPTPPKIGTNSQDAPEMLRFKNSENVQAAIRVGRDTFRPRPP